MIEAKVSSGTAAGKQPRPVIAFVWSHFGGYHMDRCRAAGEQLADRADVIGIEVGSTSNTYEWGVSGEGVGFEKITLFPGRNSDDVTPFQRFKGILRVGMQRNVTHLFLTGYDRYSYFILALIFRLRGRRVFTMLASKFDDKPRRLSREIGKAFLLLPFHGGLGGGKRTVEYLAMLGMRGRPLYVGYDSVSMARMRSMAPDAPPPWEDRAFVVVARFVPKKNLATLLRAYAGYRARAQGTVRRLRLCGSGPLEAELRAQADALGIADTVDFLGFQPQDGVARELAAGLCLLLPSYEEQWGLVVNEALAFDLPVIVSDNVGARDALVGSLDNGFVLDPDDVDAWSEAMLALAENRAMWDSFAAGSRRRAPLGDTGAFVEGCAKLVFGDGG